MQDSPGGELKTYIKIRREICESCEHKKVMVGVNTCGKCGCALWPKTIAPVSKCPIDKWGPVPMSELFGG